MHLREDHSQGAKPQSTAAPKVPGCAFSEECMSEAQSRTLRDKASQAVSCYQTLVQPQKTWRFPSNYVLYT